MGVGQCEEQAFGQQLCHLPEPKSSHLHSEAGASCRSPVTCQVSTGLARCPTRSWHSAARTTSLITLGARRPPTPPSPPKKAALEMGAGWASREPAALHFPSSPPPSDRRGEDSTGWGGLLCTGGHQPDQVGHGSQAPVAVWRVMEWSLPTQRPGEGRTGARPPGTEGQGWPSRPSSAPAHPAPSCPPWWRGSLSLFSSLFWQPKGKPFLYGQADIMEEAPEDPRMGRQSPALTPQPEAPLWSLSLGPQVFSLRASLFRSPGYPPPLPSSR